MKATCPADAMTKALHEPRVKGTDYAHSWEPRCCGAEPHDRNEALKLIDALGEDGWFLKPVVSLPETAPKGDPATAAGRIEDLNDRQWAVWWLLSFHGPSTDEELTGRYGYLGDLHRAQPGAELVWKPLPPQTPQSIRSRRAELVRAGHVIDTGERRPTKAGGSARVWRAVGDATEVAA